MTNLLIALLVYLISVIWKKIEISQNTRKQGRESKKAQDFVHGRVVYRDDERNDSGRHKQRKTHGKQYILLNGQTNPEDTTRKSAIKPAAGAPVPSGARLVYCPNCGGENLISQYETSDHYYCCSCAGNLFEAIQ